MNSESHPSIIAEELHLKEDAVRATLALLGEGATVPFIARYRKEATGELDEVAIAQIRDRQKQLVDLEKRRKAIIKSLEERKLLNDELENEIYGSETMADLEDVYQPYRPKRRTKAMIAREKGLEPLADFIFNHQDSPVFQESAKFIDPVYKKVASAQEALDGARDILAERFCDDTDNRKEIRKIYQKEAVLHCKMVAGKEVEGSKFKDYFDWNEPLTESPSHRILAIRRGEAEGVLSMRVKIDEEKGMGVLKERYVSGEGLGAEHVTHAIEDGYKRLMAPSMETESRMTAKQRADEEAIRVFASNLRELLMASPLGGKRTLAIDPGFRTGCKVVCLDAQGKLLHNDVIFPQRNPAEAAAKIKHCVETFDTEAVAIGNGTASRETEKFIREQKLPGAILTVLVNEAGASIYSASEVARDEFPDKDITVRGAVSIGRRLMDPLAELVKIDAKSIGVGQYQHDVDQKLLQSGLDDTVESCVNQVGVEVNTASRELLSYVSGLNKGIATNIVAYRNENGPFTSRSELKKVPKLGKKAFEQAAGFLRIRDAKNPLDASAVHPERYAVVEKMLKDAKVTLEELIQSDSTRKSIELENYVSDSLGMPTLKDMMSELAKPGRDPRKQFESVSFTEGVDKLEHLKEGQKLPGVVTNVTAFGAFVDVGVHQDGLVHISELADKFVKDPAEVVKVGQKVNITVLSVDLERKRAGFSMKADPFAETARPAKKKSAPNRSRKPQNRNQGQQRPRPSAGVNDNWFEQAMNEAKE